jgi:hypothetical protein
VGNEAATAQRLIVGVRCNDDHGTFGFVRATVDTEGERKDPAKRQASAVLH